MAAAHQHHGEQRSSEACDTKYAVHGSERGSLKTLSLASEVKSRKGDSPFFPKREKGSVPFSQPIAARPPFMSANTRGSRRATNKPALTPTTTVTTTLVA